MFATFLKESLVFDASLNALAENLYSNKELEDRILETFDDNYLVRQDANQELKGLYSSLKRYRSSFKTTCS